MNKIVKNTRTSKPVQKLAPVVRLVKPEDRPIDQDYVDAIRALLCRAERGESTGLVFVETLSGGSYSTTALGLLNESKTFCLGAVEVLKAKTSEKDGAMSQNRDAPAYQEYAAALMAKLAYRTMTLQERGLAWTMRNECWVNGRLPGRHDLLAKVLGVSEQEIDDCLPAVMPFFSVSEGAIFCPELEDYRKHLEEQKAKKIAGGKLGATITNKKKKNAKSRMDTHDTANPTTTPPSMPTTEPQLPRRVKVGSLVQSSTVKPSQDQSLEKEVINDPWLDEYDSATKQSEVTV